MPQKSSIPRSLRRRSTDAEKRVWHFLRNRQLGGWKFRRQVWIDRYIVDFVCLDAKLVVELDGSQHAENVGSDLLRSGILERNGFRVVRYRNSDVLSNTSEVLDDIIAHLELRKCCARQASLVSG
ncbi:DUF559 domain-containing protein [Roseibium sp.]|uniref:endonuclease domain-containing protein n=1 Tax=Roseibium sp. TaxID=1936156 RepID=UPI0032651F63